MQESVRRMAKHTVANNSNKKIKNIKNVKRCRDGTPKSVQTR